MGAKTEAEQHGDGTRVINERYSDVKPQDFGFTEQEWKLIAHANRLVSTFPLNCIY